jgi:hypothetical protein
MLREQGRSWQSRRISQIRFLESLEATPIPLPFSVEVALEGERLTTAECRQLMAAKEALVLLKGKWVEIDRDRLN